MRWSKQELECFEKKRSGGCKICPVFYAYQIKNCKMFPHVLKKITLFGEPKLIETGRI